jgi:hypothetical protein
MLADARLAHMKLPRRHGKVEGLSGRQKHIQLMGI